jgi:hypothetical protein
VFMWKEKNGGNLMYSHSMTAALISVLLLSLSSPSRPLVHQHEHDDVTGGGKHPRVSH